MSIFKDMANYAEELGHDLSFLYKSSKKDKFEKDINKINIDRNAPTTQIIKQHSTDSEGNDTYIMRGPFIDSDTDGRVILAAINNDMMLSFYYATTWICNNKSFKPFNAWYISKTQWFFDEICMINYETIKRLAKELESKVPELGVELLEVLPQQYGTETDIIKDFLYQCIVVAIQRGEIADTYNICKNIYSKTECHKILNDFPLRGKNTTVDGRTLNIGVAFWICYTAVQCIGRKYKFSDSALKTYEELIKILNYKDIKMISKEETVRYSGLDKRLFIDMYTNTVKDMIFSNRDAIKMLYLIRYVYLNSVLRDNFWVDFSVVTHLNYKGNDDKYHSESYGSLDFTFKSSKYMVKSLIYKHCNI